MTSDFVQPSNKLTSADAHKFTFATGSVPARVDKLTNIPGQRLSSQNRMKNQ